MARPFLFLYLGSQRLQAAWAPHAKADAVPLFESAFHGAGDSEADPFEPLLTACTTMPALSKGFVACVLLSDHWVPSASVPWDARQLSPARALLAAHDQIREAGYELRTNDIVRIDDSPLRQPRLAVAYPQALVVRIGDAVRRGGGVLRSVSTLSALAWRGVDSHDRHARDVERVIAIVEPAEAGARPTVVLARGQSRSACLDEVVTRPLPSSVNGALLNLELAVQPLVERLGWLPAAAPSSVEELALTVTVIPLASENTNATLPAALAWWTAAPRRRHCLAVHTLDAIARTARPSAPCLAFLCMAIALIGLLGWNLWQAEALLLHDRDDERQVQRQVLPPAAPTAAQLRRIAAINTAVTELNIPLPELLRALEAPKDIRMALLGIEVAGRSADAAGRGTAVPVRPTLKLHVESPSSLDMTRYVALLADRKPLVHAYLTRHEVPDRTRELQEGSPAEASSAAYRYTVEVEWQD